MSFEETQAGNVRQERTLRDVTWSFFLKYALNLFLIFSERGK